MPATATTPLAPSAAAAVVARFLRATAATAVRARRRADGAGPAGLAGLTGLLFLWAAAGTSLAQSPPWTPAAPASPPLNLVLLSLDTTRQDYLSCYGFAKPTTPNLDRLAAEGILFLDATTPVPITLPAHTTMLTGLYPHEHGVRNNGSFIVPPEAQTLAELLKQQGYATGAVMGAFPLESRFGLNQGFDFYDDRFSSASAALEGEFTQRPAAEVTRIAREWIAKQNGPFFLWAHYYDPHAPYRPVEPFASRFPGDAYSGEIAAMDAAIGDLVQELKTRGLYERTVIIVAADHGEGLGEHDERTHTIFIYATTQRIPFLVRLPASGPLGGSAWRGRKVDGLVSLIDLMPTAWNALGLPRASLPAMTGQSLLPLVQGQAKPREWVYHETLVPSLEYGASDLRGIETADWKYIRAPREELYNIRKDPKELKNLASKEKAQVRSMQAQLDQLLRNEAGAAPGAVDPETAERLRSLGYLGGTGDLSGSGPKADPKDIAWVYESINQAQTLAAVRQNAAALRLVDSVLTAHPAAPLAKRLKGTYLTRLGRGAEAVRVYDDILKGCTGDCPDEARQRQERASALFTAGRAADALREVRALRANAPREQGLWMLEGEILESQKETAGARAAYAKEAELFPREPLPQVKLGNLELAAGRKTEAERAYRRALEANPRYTDALVMLADLLDTAGRGEEGQTYTDQAMASNPFHPGANLRRGIDLQRAGRRDEALKHYRTALEGEPGNAAILFQLGTLYREMQRNDDAARAYQQSIATGHAPQGAYSNLGVLHAMQGRLPEAVKLWEEGLRREPNGPAAEAIRSNLARAKSQSTGAGGRK